MPEKPDSATLAPDFGAVTFITERLIVSTTERQAKIRIVLVNTAHPGNIGGAARAMKNMGLAELYLVQPREYPAPELCGVRLAQEMCWPMPL